MQRFYSIKSMKEVFPIAAMLVENRYLFFVTYYNNILFKLDIERGSKEEILIPFIEVTEWAYRKIFYYNGKIYLIPFKEKCILKYDVERNEFSSILHVLFESSVMPEAFRDVLVIGNKMFLLPTEIKELIYIDLDKEEVVERFILQEHLHGNTAISIKQYNDWILIFCKAHQTILTLNPFTGHIDRIKMKHNVCFAEVVDEWIYYTASSEEVEGIYRLNLSTLREEKIVDIQYEKPEKIRNYRFWNYKKIGDKIFFLPHETTKIVTYNLKNGEVESIDPFVDGYINHRMRGEKAVMDIIAMKNNYIVIPYLGNSISILDNNGNIVKSYEIQVQSELVKKIIIEQGATEGIVGLNDFIEYVKNEL